MIFTLADARTFCAEYVGNGVGPTHSSVLTTLNESSMLVMNDDKLWKHTVQKILIATRHNTVAMPHNVESAIGVASCVSPMRIHGMGYEFLEGGPGVFINGNSINAHDLSDLGDGHPTFYPIGKEPMKIAAFSTEAGDVGKEMRIRGYDNMHMDILPKAPGEVIKIQQWRAGVEGDIDYDSFTLSTNSFLEIQSIIKDVTAGHVTLMAYDETNYYVFILGKYLPDEIQPGYRRYLITGTTCDKDADPKYMTFLVKMRYVPLKYESDVLPIQNLIAYKWLCKSIHMTNEGDLEGGLSYRGMAERELNMQLQADQLGQDGVVDFTLSGYTMKASNESVI